MHAVRAVAENHKPSLSGPSSTLFLLLHGPFFPIRAHAEVLQGRKFQKNSQSSVNDEPSLSASEPSTEGVRNFWLGTAKVSGQGEMTEADALWSVTILTTCDTVLRLIGQVWLPASWIFCFPQRVNTGKETQHWEFRGWASEKPHLGFEGMICLCYCPFTLAPYLPSTWCVCESF